MVEQPQALHQAPTRTGPGRSMIPLLAASHFWNDAYGTVYPALVPLMMGLLHWSVTVAALVGAVGWSSQIIQPLVGRLIDARPHRYYVGGALTLGAVAVLLEPLTRNYWLFVLLVLIGGAASSLFHPPSLSLVGKMAGPRRGGRMASFLVAGNAGRAAGPLLASLLILWVGNIAGASWIAIPGFLMAGLAFFYMPASEAQVTQGQRVWPLLRSRSGPLFALLGISASRGLITTSLVALLPVWYRIQGGPALKSSIFIAVLLFVGSLGNGLGGTLSDSWPRKWVLAVGSLGAGLGMLLFVHMGGLASLLMIGVIGLFAMSSSSVTMVMGQELFPESRGMASGIALGLGNTLGAVVVAGLSIVAGRAGVPTALYLAGVLALTGIPLALKFDTWKKRAGLTAAENL